MKDLSAWSGLVGVVVGVLMTTGLDVWRTRRTSRRAAREELPIKFPEFRAAVFKPAAVAVLIDGNIVGFLDREVAERTASSFKNSSKPDNIWSAVLSLSAAGTAGTSASDSR